MADTNRYRRRERGIWVGFIFMLGGAVILADRILAQGGVKTPPWLLSWPMILILIGMVNGFRHGFRNLTWAILLLVGAIFLANEIVPSLSLDLYAWPISVIGIGLILILGTRLRGRGTLPGNASSWPGPRVPGNPPPVGGEAPERDDFFSTTAVFGGVIKKLYTTRFLGGSVTNFMGGSQIDMAQCDLTGPAQITITQIFGATKLILPPHWTVKSEIMILFGGVDDKRDVLLATPDPGKVLVLKGATIFGGIEIRSY